MIPGPRQARVSRSVRGGSRWMSGITVRLPHEGSLRLRAGGFVRPIDRGHRLVHRQSWRRVYRGSRPCPRDPAFARRGSFRSDPRHGDSPARHQTEPVEELFKRQCELGLLPTWMRRLILRWNRNSGGTKRPPSLGTFTRPQATTTGLRPVVTHRSLGPLATPEQIQPIPSTAVLDRRALHFSTGVHSRAYPAQKSRTARKTAQTEHSENSPLHGVLIADGSTYNSGSFQAERYVGRSLRDAREGSSAWTP